MRELLSYLGRQVHALTVYDYTGPDEQLERLAGVVQGYGVTLEQATTDGAGPTDVAVLHRDGSVLGATHVETLLEWTDIERGFDRGHPESPPLLSEVSGDIAVKPALTIEEMIRISREFERRALRAEAGKLHAGFQKLSQIKHSERTVEMYTALAESGVDVHVYGVPDVTLPDIGWTVHEADGGELVDTWFVCYRSGDAEATEGVLVAEEHDDGYDGFWSYRSDLAEQLDAYLRARY